MGFNCRKFSSGVVSAVIILCTSGIVSAPAIIYIRTLLQLTISKEMLGQVITGSSAIAALGYPVGTMLAASAVSTVGQANIEWLYAIFGGDSLFLTVCFMVLANDKQKDSYLHKQQGEPHEY